MDRPTTLAFRVDDLNPGHVRVSVFAGRNPGARAHAGMLTFRVDEWGDLVTQIARLRAIAAPDWSPCDWRYLKTPAETAERCVTHGVEATDDAARVEHTLRSMFLDACDAAIVPDIIGDTHDEGPSVFRAGRCRTPRCPHDAAAAVCVLEQHDVELERTDG